MPTVFPKDILLLVIFFIIIEWIGREHQYAIQRFGFKLPRPVRLSFYYTLILFILVFMGKEQVFIYFQF
jgi:hypothetical protein